MGLAAPGPLAGVPSGFAPFFRPGRDDRHLKIDQRQNFGVWRRLPERDIRHVAPLAAKTVEAGLRCELGN